MHAKEDLDYLKTVGENLLLDKDMWTEITAAEEADEKQKFSC